MPSNHTHSIQYDYHSRNINEPSKSGRIMPNLSERHTTPLSSLEPSGDDIAREKARAETLERTLKSRRYFNASSLTSLPSSVTTAQNVETFGLSASKITDTMELPMHGRGYAIHTCALPRSLSVFNSPTATFAWPQFQLASQMQHDPAIYVSLKCNSTTKLSPDAPNEMPLPHKQTNSHSVSRHAAVLEMDEATTSMRRQNERRMHQATRSKRRSPISNRDSNSSPISRLVEPLKKIQLDGDDSSSSAGLRYNSAEPATRNFDYQLVPPLEQKILDISHKIYSRPYSPSAPKSETTSGSDTELLTLRSSPRIGESRKWEDYARQVRDEGGITSYQCLWILKNKENPIQCQYISKKQLVKRHIETTHLKFKPFICELCRKAFPQKTSLDIHRSGHTGDTPHECVYNCGKAFKDPARRHRHHVEAHGYVPKHAKKKHKSDIPHGEDPSEYESMQPWNLCDTASSTR